MRVRFHVLYYMYALRSEKCVLICSKLRAKLGLKPLEVEGSKQEGEEGAEVEGNSLDTSWNPMYMYMYRKLRSIDQLKIAKT